MSRQTSSKKALNALFQESIPIGLDDQDRAALHFVYSEFKAISRKEIRVVFFGVFKAGKSTLLNAMLGWDLLPTGANRVTGIVTRLRNSTAVRARVLHKGKRYPEDVSLNDARRLIRLDLSTGRSIASDDIDVIEIDLPNENFVSGVTYIDTPGLRDTPELTARVRRELAEADLAIMLIDATKLFGDDETQEAARINEFLNGNLIFVLTRLEVIEEDQKDAVEWIQALLEKEMFGNDIVGRPRIFALRTKDALQARQNKHNQHSAVHGLKEFEDWLRDLLTGTKCDQVITLSRNGRVRDAVVKAQQQCSVSMQELSLKVGEEERMLDRQKEKVYQTTIAELDRAVKALQQENVQTETLIKQLNAQITQQVNVLMERDANWKDKVSAIIVQNINAFTQDVRQRAQRCLDQNVRVVPPFQPQFQIEGATINTDGSTGWSIAAGVFTAFLFGITGPIGWLAGFGATWASKNYLDGQAKTQMREKVGKINSALSDEFRKVTPVYFTDQIRAVTSLRQKEINQLKPPPRLAMLRSQLDDYRIAMQWCESVQREMDHLVR